MVGPSKTWHVDSTFFLYGRGWPSRAGILVQRLAAAPTGRYGASSSLLPGLVVRADNINKQVEAVK